MIVMFSTERTSKDTLLYFWIVVVLLVISINFNNFYRCDEMFYAGNFKGAWWLYHEIELTEDGFELGILFDCHLKK